MQRITPPPARWYPASVALAALFWLTAVVATIWLSWGVLMPAVNQRSDGFATTYTSARLMLAGKLGPQIYNDDWFRIHERRLGLGDGRFGLQPPTMALLMIPVAWIPPALARSIWLALDMLWLLGISVVAVALAYRAGAAVSPAWVAVLIIVGTLYQPLHADLRDAHVYSLLAMAYAIWLYSYATGRDWPCAVTLAALSLTTLASAPLWLVLLASRRWRVLAWSAGLTLTGILGTLPLVGIEAWQAYLFDHVANLAAGTFFEGTASQTILSLLSQTFIFDPALTPVLPTNTPWLAVTGWLAIAATLLGLTLIRAKPEQRLLTGAATICLVVPLQPVGAQNHYMIILAPLLLAPLLSGRLARRIPAAIALIGIALALLLAPTYLLGNAAWANWLGPLLAYPCLFGALALWGALLVLRRASHVAAHSGCDEEVNGTASAGLFRM